MITAEALAEVIDEEYYKENHYYWSATEPITFAAEVAIQLSKLHVEEALKVGAERVYYSTTRDKYRNITDVIIHKESILTAYSLDNIQ